jgi:type I restriction enzyme M protein
VDWGKDEHVKAKVIADNCAGGRFEAGLPSTNDGSLLFLQHMISKMDPQNGSRIGIVLNGSPLFNGDAGSGWSNIRKMLLDKNLLDCIVALPKNLFYGTDISTYLWILDNKRPEERREKVLFIDAAHTEYTKLLQKNLGKKRFEISEEGAKDILNIYRDYKSCSRDIVYEKTGEKEHIEIAKLLDYDDFRYTTVATRRPLRLIYDYAKAEENLDNAKLKDAERSYLEQVMATWKEYANGHSMGDFALFTMLKQAKVKFTAAQIKLVRNNLGTISEEAKEAHEKPNDINSDFVADSALNDTEKIPQKQDIDDYFEREVLPYAPDAWMDRSKDKPGVEFPFTRLFYIYRPLRSSEEILAELNQLDKELDNELKALKG